MCFSIGKLTNTFCDQLTNLTSILNHNVNVEQTSRGSGSSETRKRHHHEVPSSKYSDDSDGNDTPTYKNPRVNSHYSCVQS